MRMIRGILIVLMLFCAVMYLNNGDISPTARVVGLSDCKASLTLVSIPKIALYLGSTAEVEVTIKDVRCGVSHAVLELADVPTELFTITPGFHAAIAPKEEKKYTVRFDIPENAETLTYLGTYKLRTDVGIFTRSTLEVDIIEAPEKPAAEVSRISEEMKELEEVEVTMEVGRSGGAKFWWTLGLVAAIIYVILFSGEYFKQKGYRKKSAETHSKKKLGDALKKDK